MVYLRRGILTAFIVFVMAACGELSAGDLAAVDLEPLLIQSGDLPAGFSGAQVKGEAPGMFKNVPPPAKAIDQRFERQGKSAGGVVVLLYANSGDLASAYAATVDGMSNSGSSIEGLGEQSFLTQADTPVLDFAEGLFRRCTALVHVRFTGIKDVSVASAYLKRLDSRIQPVVCP